MKKLISLLLIVSILLTTLAINVSAARNEEYISEVALIYKNTVEEAKQAIAGTEWKLFEQDLNANADIRYQDGVYLIYKTSTNVEDAITDLRVMDMYGGYSTTNYEKKLEESRAQYDAKVADLRIVANEFKAKYEAGDAMALLAYRQMNYYKDVKTQNGTETDMLMGDFFLNMPPVTENSKVTQVIMEGNSIIVSNLISLLAVGISGANGDTLATRIAANYAIKDNLTSEVYYDEAVALVKSFESIKAKLIRYDALKESYDFEDEEMTEGEYEFLTQYATIAVLMQSITYGETTLAEFLKGTWTVQDLYPIVASLTAGQKALINMGQIETVLKYNSPSKPIDELNAAVEEAEAELKDENGNLEVIDVYTGVDRSIFKGDFAVTTAAERQQALTGKTWTWSDAAARSKGVKIGYIVASVVDVAALGVALGLHISYHVMITKAAGDEALLEAAYTFSNNWSPVAMGGYVLAAALTLIILGGYGISTWVNYYNPDYLAIPNTLVDVKATDLGDRYIKYDAAKVFEDGKPSEKNADFNAYQGKEWNALYYTKDATAGNCLTPNFVFKENDSTIARRHQGVAMFGEAEAFNLNSHVYNANAKGAYLTVRYSTAKKAAADMPTVVGSMFATGALYTLTALAGAGAGVGGTLLVQKAKKKKSEANEPEEANV